MTIAEKRKFLENKYLSAKFGLIKEIVNVDNPLGGVEAHGAIAKLADPSFLEHSIDEETAGFSLNSEDEAVVTAIMEGLERYSSAIRLKNDVKNYEKVKSKNFRTFINRFGTPNVDFKDISYCKFTNLEGNEVFLPSQYAYFPASAEKDKQIIHNTTNGLAAYTSRSIAKEKAILELIEREGILRTWINKIAPPQINLEGTEFEQISQNLARNELQLDVFQVNIIPEINTAIALVTDPDPKKAFLSFGAGASTNLKESVGSAIEECLHTRIWQEHYYDTQPEKPDHIEDLFDRSHYWASEKDNSKLEFLYENTEYIDLKSWSGEEKSNIEDLELPPIYLKDVTAPELSKNNIFVYRAFCPEFQPFYLNEEKGNSLNQLCRGKEVIGGVKTGEKPNKIPHPML